jgi:hypothetical protein
MTTKSREAGFIVGAALGLFGGAIMGAIVTIMALVSMVGPGN